MHQQRTWTTWALHKREQVTKWLLKARVHIDAQKIFNIVHNRKLEHVFDHETDHLVISPFASLCPGRLFLVWVQILWDAKKNCIHIDEINISLCCLSYFFEVSSLWIAFVK